ncbi:MAG TPA: rhodanese-like domain-containing protein [Gaiellales bacterium]|jgi:rhodanese-related sulfurtransferase/catechol 2,3-dioxygenase-like lactoylglutathione lyase family enzyme|nr:rhodanese-like domain-containing protein [Gaiellales bacterium]
MTPPLDDLLADARTRYRQLAPAEALEAMGRGAVMLDTRSHEQRVAGGLVPGAIRIHRNVLEWRVDPASGYQDPRIAAATGEVIVMCQQGYSSTLAAEMLLRLGVDQATDVAGGFEAWAAAGLPVEPYRPGGILGACELIAFVATTDAERSRGFYEETLALPLVEQTPYAIVFDAGGTQLRVTTAREVVAAPYTVLGWRVPDIGAAVEELMCRGVEFARFEGMEQDSLGVWAAPGGVRVAWFRDPDGNVLAVSQHP